MSTKTKTKQFIPEKEELRIEIKDSDSDKLVLESQQTRDSFDRMKNLIKETRKDKVEEGRRAKYLLKAIDIVASNIPTEDEKADQNSEKAWKKREKVEKISRHLTSTSLGPMSGQEVRIIPVEGENPDAVPVRIEVHEGMSPEASQELGQLARWTEEDISLKK